MESDGYRQRLKDITVDLMTLVLEMENDEHEKEQLFKIFRPGERIIAFPNLATTKKEETKNEDNEVFLEFTEKEIMKMPKNFRKDFKTGKIKAHIRRREDGRYEVRCQINKKRISATSKTLEIAKQKFIKQLNALTTPQATVTRKNVTLYDYMKKWLETTKKPYIKPNTYKFYLQTFNADIVPRLGTRELTSIKTFELQDFINEYTNAKKFRTAKKIAQLLSAVFDYEFFQILKLSNNNSRKHGELWVSACE